MGVVHIFLYFSVLTGKLLIFLMRIAGRNATTLPGIITYKMSRKLPEFLTRGQKVILVTGTNGKTTTVRILCSIYRSLGYKVITNVSGANLISGIITAMIESLTLKDIVKSRNKTTNNEVYNESNGLVIILEIDEAVFAKYSNELNPSVIAVTNLFRDQLDRYGELSKIRELIRAGILKSQNAKVVLCADDSLSASLGTGIEKRVLFAGVEKDSMSQSDVLLKDNPEAGNCVFCNAAYVYEGKTFGHLGNYKCPSCSFKRPEPEFSVSYTHAGNNNYNIILNDNRKHENDKPDAKSQSRNIGLMLPIPGEHNVYNALTAFSTALAGGISAKECLAGIKSASSGFGRMERFVVEGKDVCTVLVKNPAGLDRALDFLNNADDLGSLLFLLNDNDADGTDVSWIWDVDFESRTLPGRIYVSGTRCYDMALRIQYAGSDKSGIIASEDFVDMFKQALSECGQGKCFYILPNYTSMLSLRKYMEKKYKLKGIWE